MSVAENNLSVRLGDRMGSSDLLPEFERPPVTEVALSLQFEPLSKLRGPVIGLLWGKFKDRYPVVEEHSPIDPVIETFGASNSVSRIKFQVLDAPPPARVWFMSQTGQQLIQVQQDRFIYNWRKLSDEDTYPRYSQLRKILIQELELFDRFVKEEQLGDLIFKQTEVTFVNTIISGEGWQRPGQLHNVLTIHSGAYSDTFFDEPESIQTALRYVIPDESGNPVGRLHITVVPLISLKGKEPALNLTLIARCTPDGSIEDAIRCLDLAHRWMVKGFASITTKEMHRIWERKG
jgi:uncharacterized protein (TIGR04255 family)